VRWIKKRSIPVSGCHQRRVTASQGTCTNPGGSYASSIRLAHLSCAQFRARLTACHVTSHMTSCTLVGGAANAVARVREMLRCAAHVVTSPVLSEYLLDHASLPCMVRPYAVCVSGYFACCLMHSDIALVTTTVELPASVRCICGEKANSKLHCSLYIEPSCEWHRYSLACEFVSWWWTVRAPCMPGTPATVRLLPTARAGS
jgi:hypothetical protein